MASLLRPTLTFAILALCLIANAQLAGNYTINSAVTTGGTNFQSFSDFAASINSNGVSGNVTATVVAGSGPYNEQVIFNNIPGAGSNATVTLEGSGETITAVTTSTDRHVVRLTDIQYFTINNLKVAWDSSSTGGFYGIHLFNTGNYITITHCKVDLSGTTSTLYGAYVASGSETSILATGDFHNITIKGDTAVGGGYGASVFGLISPLASNIIITGNVFNDFHSNGVYLRETDSAEVSYNHFDKNTPSVTSCNAIQVAQAANINSSIFNNFIKVSQTMNGSVTIRGIYLFDGTGHKVYNNVIHDINLVSGNFTGIEVRTGGTAPEIYFNTISIDNAGTTSGELFGIAEELSNTNSVLRNNMISISQPTTAVKAGLVLGAISTVTTALNSDYNLIWVPNGNVALKNPFSPTYYASLADWQIASTQDANSITIDPLFISLSLPVPTNPAADDAGTSIAWITTDVLGVIREPTPDIGAYEFPLTVGMEKEFFTAQIQCYPNPVSNELTIESFSEEKVMDLLLFDLSGKLLMTQKIFPGLNKADVSEIAEGLYLIEVKNDEVEYYGKLLIKH